MIELEIEIEGEEQEQSVAQKFRVKKV